MPCAAAPTTAKRKPPRCDGRDRLRNKLAEIDTLRKRKAKPAPIERRIGKWVGRNTAAGKTCHVDVQGEDGWAVELQIQKDESQLERARHAQGAYLLRTNCREQDPQKLWHWYIRLTEVEDAFRTSKSNLSLRPVYHQLEHRVLAHVLVCFIALAMWRSFEMWLQGAGMGHCGRQVIRELDAIRSMAVELGLMGTKGWQTGSGACQDWHKSLGEMAYLTGVEPVTF